MSGDPRQVLGPVLAAAVEALAEERVETAVEGKSESEFVTVTEAAYCSTARRMRTHRRRKAQR